MNPWLLWTLAFLLMLAAAAWQRRTGPSYPLRGEVPAAGGAQAYSLPRSHESTSDAEVTLRVARSTGVLFWRRYPTGDAFRGIPLQLRGTDLVAAIPRQPPAGKVEYFVELFGANGSLRVPQREAAVLRYHGPVPLAILVPHILMMFLSMLVAVRTALGALVGRQEARLAWLALAGFTVGGLVLGPIVQKHAFGAYWTGVPWGWDLTDNKMLVMWAVWLLACLAPLRWPRSRRMLVLGAAAVTLIVYLIPHSARGSQLDYQHNRLRAQATAPAPAA